MTQPQLTSEHIGVFHRVRVRFFGEPDPVASQLRDLERQGTLGAHVAHALAYLLILLFSLGSLVALGGDALQHAIAGWQRGTLDIPALIALGVTTLLVPAMDAAMLYAASMLRLLASRRADASEMRLHKWVIIGVSLVEAATYTYMSWRYEQPADAIAWGLIVARALASPLLAIYLSMARPLPVTPRDILYQVEMATGLGVIRDAVRIANDQEASLARKMALYGASAVMASGDRDRLNNMIAVMSSQESETAAAVPPDPLPVTQAEQADAQPPDDDRTPPPPQGGLPTSYDVPEEPPAQAATATAATSYDTSEGLPGRNGHRPQGKTRSRAAKQARVRIVGEGMAARRERQRRQADAILSKDPDTNPTALAKKIRSTWKTANRLKNDWQARQPQQRLAAVEG